MPGKIFNCVSQKSYKDDANFMGVTDRELVYALRQQANGKGPGPDELDAIVVKHMYNNYRSFVKLLFD